MTNEVLQAIRELEDDFWALKFVPDNNTVLQWVRKELNVETNTNPKKTASERVARKPWTEDELRYAEELAKDMNIREIADVLERSYASVLLKLHKTGIKIKATANEYTVYYDNEYVAEGTAKELQQRLNFKQTTFYNYASSANNSKRYKIIKKD